MKFHGWIALSIMTILIGCASKAPRQSPARSVNLAEFAGGNSLAASAPSEDADAAPSQPVTADPPPPTANGVTSNGAAASPPPASTPRPPRATANGPTFLKPGQRLVVDSLIGQVNGRPVFADEFFRAAGDRLDRAAEQFNVAEFIKLASQTVDKWLEEMIVNELFLAEAESGLTEDQKRGLFAYMRAIQDEVIRRNAGTRSETERRIADEMGLSLEEFLARYKNESLIDQLIKTRIEPRVIVSWRDMELEYERRRAEFNPPGKVVVGRLTLNKERDAQRIEQAKADLADGKPFEEVALAAGASKERLYIEFPLNADGKPEMSPAFQQALGELVPGKTAEPLDQGNALVWLHVAEIRQPQARSLFDEDVQKTLHDSLKTRREKEERERFISSLMARGVYDDVNQMGDRLKRIVGQRYLKP